MKILSVFMLLFMLSSCVSIFKYKASQSEYNKSVQTGYQYNKDMARLKQLNAKMRNEINLLTIDEDSMNSSVSKKYILKRLEKHGIKVKAADFNPEYLPLKHPTLRERYINTETINYSKLNPDTARNIKWLTNKEKDIYYWLNYARMYPRDFCDKYILPLMETNADPNYLLTLIDYMYEMKPMNPLIPDKSLYESAKCHAESTGKAGIVGHDRLKGCTSKYYGECCDYGNFSAKDHVIRLLVDEHVSSLGHRYISLGFYDQVGISVASHIKYSETVVFDFW
jgi:hypothetical protein